MAPYHLLLLPFWRVGLQEVLGRGLDFILGDKAQVEAAKASTFSVFSRSLLRLAQVGRSVSSESGHYGFSMGVLVYGFWVEVFLRGWLWVVWWFHPRGISIGLLVSLGLRIGCYGLGLRVGLFLSVFWVWVLRGGGWCMIRK